MDTVDTPGTGRPKRYRRRVGSVEAATRSYIGDLGKLSPRQEVQAAGLVVLARRIDLETSGAKLAALHRELRMALPGLREIARVGDEGLPAPARSPGRPPRGKLAELADARQRRAAKAAGEAGERA